MKFQVAGLSELLRRFPQDATVIMRGGNLYVTTAHTYEGVRQWRINTPDHMLPNWSIPDPEQSK